MKRMAKKWWTRRIIHAYCDEEGECEGMFDYDTKELLDLWSCNDATWRTEYFGGFMEKLGIKEMFVDSAEYKKFHDLLLKAAKDSWG
jgi:hypothetical protein